MSTTTDREPRIYRTIRFYFSSSNDPRRPRTLRTGLTLSEAQAHCQDPETSSSTCSAATKRRVPGRWFDGYDYMRGCRPRE